MATRVQRTTEQKVLQAMANPGVSFALSPEECAELGFDDDDYDAGEAGNMDRCEVSNDSR